MNEQTKLYFAYGSNINLVQMKFRCPNAERITPVTLRDYSLSFRGAGFATVLPEEGSEVKGLLWEITEKCERVLDLYEGVADGHYSKQEVTVRDALGNEFSAMVYVMTEERSQVVCFPHTAYHDGILEGYIQNDMDTEPLKDALNRCFQEERETYGIPGQTKLEINKKTKKREKER